MTPDLAARQAALVAALVAGGPPPPGFDADLLAVAARALRRKRAGEVARAWPLLAASLGAGFAGQFGAWADGRPSAGSFADGLAFARSLRDAGALPPLGATELDQCEGGRASRFLKIANPFGRRRRLA